MKKLFSLTFLIALLLSSCSDEGAVKDTVSSYLKKQMKNPDSFKIESIEIRKDTIPAYLTSDMLKLAEKVMDAADDMERYSDMGYLFADEQYKAATAMLKATEALKVQYESTIDNADPVVEYVAYVKYSGTNALGGTVSNRCIVIVDSKDTKRILGSFDIDKDFVREITAIKYFGTDKTFQLKQNQFGKYDLDGLPFFERFVFNEE